MRSRANSTGLSESVALSTTDLAQRGHPHECLTCVPEPAVTGQGPVASEDRSAKCLPDDDARLDEFQVQMVDGYRQLERALVIGNQTERRTAGIVREAAELVDPETAGVVDEILTNAVDGEQHLVDRNLVSTAETRPADEHALVDPGAEEPDLQRAPGLVEDDVFVRIELTLVGQDLEDALQGLRPFDE